MWTGGENRWLTAVCGALGTPCLMGAAFAFFQEASGQAWWGCRWIHTGSPGLALLIPCSWLPGQCADVELRSKAETLLPLLISLESGSSSPSSFCICSGSHTGLPRFEESKG